MQKTQFLDAPLDHGAMSKNITSFFEIELFIIASNLWSNMAMPSVPPTLAMMRRIHALAL